MAVSTPLQRLPVLSRRLGIDLRVKRDDLFPFTGGGNKARKVLRIFPYIEREGYDSIVTTGGLQSNHARAVALAAASKGWRCILVLHSDRHESSTSVGNYLLMKLSGAEIRVVPPELIGPTMKECVEDLRRQGRTPYELPGGGHTLHGGMAYVDAAIELYDQCREEHWWPEWIVLPSGTGTTQAGLIVGCSALGLEETRVVGISVARTNPRGTEVVKQACRDLCLHLGKDDLSKSVDFRDGWIEGGYEKSGKLTADVIAFVARSEGLILDPTYTGKAFRGLLDLIRSGEIRKGSRVLFWHTGGLLNLVSSKYFAHGWDASA